MKRRHFVIFCTIGIGTFAGCITNTSDGEDQDEISRTTASLTKTTTEEPTTDQDSEKHATPHEFVFVEKIKNQSTVETVPANETAAFQNLSTQRQQTFRKGLNQSKVAAEGWNWHNESRPTFIRYNGTWYRVIVGVH